MAKARGAVQQGTEWAGVAPLSAVESHAGAVQTEQQADPVGSMQTEQHGNPWHVLSPALQPCALILQPHPARVSAGTLAW